MSAEDLGKLIDLVADAIFSEMTSETAEQVATRIVAELTSRYYLIPIPTDAEAAAEQVELDVLIDATLAAAAKGRASS